MFLRNQGRPLVSIILKLLIPIGGRITPSWVKVTVLILRQLNVVAHKQGLPGLVKNLKVHSVILQQSLAGHVLGDLTPLGPRVSRTEGGIPRLIPVLHRRRIRLGDPLIIKYYLTIFSLYRDIVIPGKMKLSTITDKFSGDEKIFKRLGKYIPTFNRLFVKNPLNPHPYSETAHAESVWNPKEAFPYELSGTGSQTRYVPNSKLLSESLRKVPRIFGQVKGFKPFPIAKSSPLTRGDEVSTHPRALLRSLASLTHNTQLGTDAMTILTRVDPSKKFARFWYNKFFKLYSKSVFPLADYDRKSPLGKLGAKLEAAGKLRLFAMVDAITQWLLEPLHRYVFSLLRLHKMDGTFDQLAPLSRAWKFKALYSLDLSAATDRLPIRLQEMLLANLLNDKDFASAWARLLVNRDYAVPPKRSYTTIGKEDRDWKSKSTEPKVVRYAVGQPMGALSSWAMLAFTHHFIVQCAAWECRIVPSTVLYEDYAILGDDVVIFNGKVAKRYLKIIKALGVECNMFKSVISLIKNKLVAEFAKKTFLRGINVSPAPLKELYSALTSLGNLRQYCRVYKLDFNDMIRLTGAGYRVMGGLNKPLHKQNNLVRLLHIVSFIPTSVADMAEFYKRLHYRVKMLHLHNVLDAFIKSYFTRFYLRVIRCIDLLENLNDGHYNQPGNLAPFTGPDKFKWREIERDLYHIAYHDYYLKSLHDLKEIKRQIEDLQSASVIGIWRLFGITLQLERELSSISTTLFFPNKIDSTPSPYAKEVRFWRQFSRELKTIPTKTLTSSQPSKLAMSGIHPLMLLSIRTAGRWVLRNWPKVRSILRRTPPIIMRRKPLGLWAFLTLLTVKLFSKTFKALLSILIIIILIVGMVSLPDTDFIWEGDINHHTYRAIMGFARFYAEMHLVDTIPTPIATAPSLWELLVFICLGFLLGTGLLWYTNFDAISWTIMNRLDNVYDVISEPNSFGIYDFHWNIIVFWSDIIWRITCGVWEQFWWDFLWNPIDLFLLHYFPELSIILYSWLVPLISNIGLGVLTLAHEVNAEEIYTLLLLGFI